MIITATELKNNLGKYLELVEEEDVLISKNGKIIAELTRPISEQTQILNSLIGYASADKDISIDKVKEERLKRQ